MRWRRLAAGRYVDTRGRWQIEAHWITCGALRAAWVLTDSRRDDDWHTTLPTLRDAKERAELLDRA